MSHPIEAIEARIRANPDDHEAWRVYADWLLDHGDRRGELIMLESLEGSTTDPKLIDAIAALTAKHRASWQPKPVQGQPSYAWMHGFVRSAQFLITWPRDFRSVRRLLADPQARLLGRLCLTFDRAIDAKMFESLVELDLGALSELSVGKLDKRRLYSRPKPPEKTGDKFIHALVQQPVLRLTELSMNSCGITNAGLFELAACAQLRGLRRLHLDNNAFAEVGGIGALANSPSLSELEELDLHGNVIGESGAQAFANSPVLGKLERLGLHAEDLGIEGARALASSGFLPHHRGGFRRARPEPESSLE